MRGAEDAGRLADAGDGPLVIGPHTLTNPSRPGSAGRYRDAIAPTDGRSWRDGGTDSPVGEKLSGPAPVISM